MGHLLYYSDLDDTWGETIEILHTHWYQNFAVEMVAVRLLIPLENKPHQDRRYKLVESSQKQNLWFLALNSL